MPLGIAEQARIAMSVAPNPVRHLLQLTFGTFFEGQLILLDGTGREVDQRWCSGQFMEWNLSSHPSGLYTLQAIERSGGGAVLRVILIN